MGMDVVSELDRVWLPSHQRHIDALLRDVGFIPIPCRLCGKDARSGFAVVVSACRHSFHYDCFVDALRADVEPNPQEAETASSSSDSEATPKAAAAVEDSLASAAEGSGEEGKEVAEAAKEASSLIGVPPPSSSKVGRVLADKALLLGRLPPLQCPTCLAPLVGACHA